MYFDILGSFVDWTIYTRNRCIRLLESSKFNDNTRVLKYIESDNVDLNKNYYKNDELRFSLITKLYNKSDYIIYMPMTTNDSIQKSNKNLRGNVGDEENLIAFINNNSLQTVIQVE